MWTTYLAMDGWEPEIRYIGFRYSGLVDSEIWCYAPMPEEVRGGND